VALSNTSAAAHTSSNKPYACGLRAPYHTPPTQTHCSGPKVQAALPRAFNISANDPNLEP
jgi:hypothetical protein